MQVYGILSYKRGPFTTHSHFRVVSKNEVLWLHSTVKLVAFWINRSSVISGSLLLSSSFYRVSLVKYLKANLAGLDVLDTFLVNKEVLFLSEVSFDGLNHSFKLLIEHFLFLLARLHLSIPVLTHLCSSPRWMSDGHGRQERLNHGAQTELK